MILPKTPLAGPSRGDLREGEGDRDRGKGMAGMTLSSFRVQIQPALFSPDPEKWTLESHGHSG